MEKNLFYILVIVSIATHTARLVYEILKNRQILKPNKISFIIMFSNMMLLWVSWILLCINDIFRISLPGALSYAGLMISAAGVVLFFIALLTIKSLESFDGDLITTGIYSKISHPMYLGFIFWLIGFPLFFGSIFSLIISPLFIANILFWKHLEEKELERRFPSYNEYRKTTIF